MAYHVYILRFPNDQRYIGSTGDLARRLAEHEAGSACRTTALYGSPKLLYSEPHPDRLSALKRERQIKGWSRGKKVALSQGNLAELKRLAQSKPKCVEGRLAQSKRKRVERHDN
jgi:predicted GIY-YIG superfamily endonuclease